MAISQGTFSFFYDIQTIYEDPYYQGGNFVGLLESGPSVTYFDKIYIVKVDINDTQTYPSGTQIISNY